MFCDHIKVVRYDKGYEEAYEYYCEKTVDVIHVPDYHGEYAFRVKGIKDQISGIEPIKNT